MRVAVRAAPFAMAWAFACLPAKAAQAEPAEKPAKQVAPLGPTAGRPWEFGPLVGFGTEWTTGLSPWGVGIGLSLDYELRCHFSFGGALIHHFGSSESALGRHVSYVAHTRSDSVAIHAGYSFWIADRVVLRPELSLEGTLVTGSSEVTGVRRSNAGLLGLIGPSGVVMVRVGTYLFGVQGNAYLVPSDVAAPVGALYAVFRTRL